MPDPAIVRVRELVKQGADLTVAEWVEKIKERTGKKNKTVQRVSADVAKAAQTLQEVGADEHAFDKIICALESDGIGAIDWRQIAKIYTGRNASSARLAKECINEHFSGLVRLSKRREALREPLS